MGWQQLREKRKTHQRHSKFDHLTVCGAGANGMTIGKVGTAKRPCRMCAKGGK
jgi:hypothetical protein